MSLRKKKLLSRFENIYRRLQLDVFRHTLRDNAFALEYNYLPIRTERQPEWKTK